MKQMAQRLFLALLLSLTTVQAGKNVTKADSPVAAVVTNPFYVGIGGVWSMISTDCCHKKRIYDSANFGGILRLGYDFNPFFGIEARYLNSRIHSKFATMSHYGLYAKPQVHISDAVNVYALVGYGHTRVDCKYRHPLYEGNGVSFGGGMEYDFVSGDGQGDAEEGFGMFIDYQNILYNRGNGKTRANVVSAGITYDF